MIVGLAFKLRFILPSHETKIEIQGKQMLCGYQVFPILGVLGHTRMAIDESNIISVEG